MHFQELKTLLMTSKMYIFMHMICLSVFIPASTELRICHMFRVAKITAPPFWRTRSAGAHGHMPPVPYPPPLQPIIDFLLRPYFRGDQAHSIC